MAQKQVQSNDQQPGTADHASENSDGEKQTELRSVEPVEHLRRLLAELLGTFLLTTVEAGGVVVSASFQQDTNSAAHYVSGGLIVMAMIYTLGSTSGAHINPAITLAFALRRDFPWQRVPGYWLAQLLGAIAAAALVRLLFGDLAHLGAPQPHADTLIVFGTEALLTFLLVTVVLGVATKGELVGNNVAISVGGTVALCGLFAGRISGASMNPARSFGPYLVSGQFGEVWLYLLAPLVGATVAAGMAWLLRGKTNAKAVEAAKGQ